MSDLYYEKPSAEPIEICPSILCLSGNSGTEGVGHSGDAITDAGFE